MSDPRPPTRAPGRGRGFRVLAVCTANQCRSPLVEHLLRRRLARAGVEGWAVTSAGTAAMQDRPVHPYVADLLGRTGVDTGGWTSTRLSPALVAGADLIVTAEARHRDDVVRLDLAARPVTFPLLQLAGLVAALDPADRPPVSEPAALLAAVDRVRHRVPTPAEVDVADPIGRSRRHFARCLATIDQALATITGIR